MGVIPSSCSEDICFVGENFTVVIFSRSSLCFFHSAEAAHDSTKFLSAGVSGGTWLLASFGELADALGYL